MATEIQLFKGGWNGDVADRIVPNQRPADGHEKPAVWESYRRLNAKSFKCGGACGVGAYKNLEVGDVLGIHTTLTMGNITAFGIAVNGAEEGFKLKVVARDGFADLSKILVTTYEYDEDNEQFVVVSEGDALDSIEDIGNANYYYAGFTENLNDILVHNTDMIGFEVVALPENGLCGEFDIETRLHNSQPVRPPASLGCC